MSLSILRGIADCLQNAEFFALLADECVDIANIEQLAVSFRYVDSHLDMHEDFTCLYENYFLP